MLIRTTRAAWILTGVVLLLSIAFTCLSLVNVPGATLRSDGGCCNTEYVRGWWSVAPTMLVVPIYVIGTVSRLLMLVAVAVAGWSVLYIASVGVSRIEDAGWGDGLELLAFVLAGFQVLLFIGAGIAGAASAAFSAVSPATPRT